VEALRQTQDALKGQDAAQQIVGKIIAQYDQLQRGTDAFQQFVNNPIGTERATMDRLASARQTIENIRSLLGNVRVQAAQIGGGLIIKTAPNTYRITFAVPMRIAPNMTFSRLPAGVTYTEIEKSNVGVTIVFSPPNIEFDLFRFLGIPAMAGK
jgi:hypothetical protein